MQATPQQKIEDACKMEKIVEVVENQRLFSLRKIIKNKQESSFLYTLVLHVYGLNLYSNGLHVHTRNAHFIFVVIVCASFGFGFVHIFVFF